MIEIQHSDGNGKTPKPRWWDGGPGWIGMVCPKGHTSRLPRAFVLSNGETDGTVKCPKKKCLWQDRAYLSGYWNPHSRQQDVTW